MFEQAARPNETQMVHDPLPTAPCTVVWSKGHAYVLDGLRCRWEGVDERNRPRLFTGAELARRGWSRRR
ncbi:hypothetical protein SK854_45675 [Lentzea sp. BCCO 10_0061]|uniref:Uncharacterized protein n=1 Tax=Lentzea sokolovensis TaxID=3095429 RepID=A0ABU4VCF4_9PSEU|nr:hypothetical protein [Lentzea sp. BCCO 10_0061]MDX8149481.1 hypothetical protein [Lentzea sp. BCCO 10_0061]